MTGATPPKENATSPATAEAGDGALLRAAAGGDRGAFAALVTRHFPAAYRLARRLTGNHADAEDIAQEAFVKLWRNPGQLRDAMAVRAWLLRVAARGAADHGRKRRPGALDEMAEPADGRPGPAAEMDRQRAGAEIERHIGRLPERQRLALQLVHFEGLSNIDAASVMGLSVEAIESLLARARRGLKERLAGDWRNLLETLTDE